MQHQKVVRKIRECNAAHMPIEFHLESVTKEGYVQNFLSFICLVLRLSTCQVYLEYLLFNFLTIFLSSKQRVFKAPSHYDLLCVLCLQLQLQLP